MDRITLRELFSLIHVSDRYFIPQLEYEVNIFGNTYKAKSELIYSDSGKSLDYVKIVIDSFAITYTIDEKIITAEITDDNLNLLFKSTDNSLINTITLKEVFGISPVKSARN
jgi:hypothetical protein